MIEIDLKVVQLFQRYQKNLSSDYLVGKRLYKAWKMAKYLQPYGGIAD